MIIWVNWQYVKIFKIFNWLTFEFKILFFRWLLVLLDCWKSANFLILRKFLESKFYYLQNKLQTINFCSHNFWLWIKNFKETKKNYYVSIKSGCLEYRFLNVQKIEIANEFVTIEKCFKRINCCSMKYCSTWSALLSLTSSEFN